MKPRLTLAWVRSPSLAFVQQVEQTMFDRCTAPLDVLICFEKVHYEGYACIVSCVWPM